MKPSDSSKPLQPLDPLGLGKPCACQQKAQAAQNLSEQNPPPQTQASDGKPLTERQRALAAAGVPLGVTFSFLISAPMVNEIAVVLLYGLLGWKVAALYMVTGLAVAIVSGLVIGKLGMERHVEQWVLNVRAGGGEDAPELTWAQRLDAGAHAVRDIVGKVWPWVLAGIAVGAGIHGYVPEGFLAGIMGRGAWWSVPVAVSIGIPMYSNAAGIVPVVHALLEKGAALGTVLAFMMSVIALSLPEMIILRKVLKPRLIAVFAGVVGAGIMLVGFLFNAIL